MKQTINHASCGRRPRRATRWHGQETGHSDSVKKIISRFRRLNRLELNLQNLCNLLIFPGHTGHITAGWA
jgi:hypothetical protein